ncbi:MAG: SAP domain-containing protein [Candidatus Thermoplasmatota archaeon]|jgi:small subunit ribosomal protein S3Ae|nr:SAP domain-containing protein [Candidatus Thermoplasmatota archaeon]MEC7460602.1 SAP domain-containing protein [Candidatus Thermoplasmatota archaeon]MEC7723309.1 SAP domain-containing protein [Candidatus Thermoplasmatota archaeon]MEC8079036.1 SAP domain-containing protein [Candidatus Thermoplasmatota archaeon]MEC8263937.1 SAP domain-containing protein [Candidatus Thermoplasmatota archaeon]
MARKMSAKARAAARKQRDKWKSKRWYTIRAPRDPWKFQNIGETIGESDEHVMGRVYEMTQQEFSGDFTKMHVILRFRVTDCVGQDALTTFIGHHHQTDHVRRQVRRYRGKVDDVVDVVTTDGYLIRIKPLIITQKRVQTSVKSDIRNKARDIIVTNAAKMTYSQIQTAMLGGDLEKDIENAVKSIYPVRTCVIRKSQLLQTGVVTEKGPTLDEIHAEEARSAAELKAKKAALLAEAMAEEGDDDADDAEAEDAPAEEAPAEEAPAEAEAEEEAPAEEEASAEDEAEPEGDAPDYASMTVAELKDELKAKGLPVSGKKAELVERLQGA